jgi:hypothetical protein
MEFRKCLLKSLMAQKLEMQFHSYFIFEFVLQYVLALSVTFGNFGSHGGDEISSYCCALERWKETKWSRFLKMAAIREFPLWLETCVICSQV